MKYRANVRTTRLTPAQSRVLGLMAEAMSYATIAARLGISHRTARHHVIAIGDALPSEWFPGVDLRERVILWAVRAYAEQHAPQTVTKLAA